MDIQLPEVSILRFVTSAMKQGKYVNFIKKIQKWISRWRWAEGAQEAKCVHMSVITSVSPLSVEDNVTKFSIKM